MPVKNTYYGYLESEVGIIEVSGDDDGLLTIAFVEEKAHDNSENPIILDALKQLDEYFKGERKAFDLKCHLNGTQFQKKVWQELIKIPYGETVNYGELAKRIGNEKACRAVGGANNKNNLAIVIPCHRVIGKNGAMVGYASGISKKEALLSMERNNA